MSKLCQSCLTELPDEATVCSKCGKQPDLSDKNQDQREDAGVHESEVNDTCDASIVDSADVESSSATDKAREVDVATISDSYPTYSSMANNEPASAQKKKSKVLIVGVVAAVVAILIGVGVLVTTGSTSGSTAMASAEAVANNVASVFSTLVVEDNSTNLTIDGLINATEELLGFFPPGAADAALSAEGVTSVSAYYEAYADSSIEESLALMASLLPLMNPEITASVEEALTVSELEDINEDFAQLGINGTAQAGNVIVVTMSYTYYGETSSDSMTEMVAVDIDGNWYLWMSIDEVF